jgi:hypothetical protein
MGIELFREAEWDVGGMCMRKGMSEMETLKVFGAKT